MVNGALKNYFSLLLSFALSLVFSYNSIAGICEVFQRLYIIGYYTYSFRLM